MLLTPISWPRPPVLLDQCYHTPLNTAPSTTGAGSQHTPACLHPRCVRAFTSSFYSFFFFIGVLLPCNAESCCTMKWISYMHTYILSSLSLLPIPPIPSLQVITDHWAEDYRAIWSGTFGLKEVFDYSFNLFWGYPSGSADKESACNAGDIRSAGSIPESGRSPGGGNGNPLQCSCLKNPMDKIMDRGFWQPTVHRVAKIQTLLMPLSITQSIQVFYFFMIWS